MAERPPPTLSGTRSWSPPPAVRSRRRQWVVIGVVTGVVAVFLVAGGIVVWWLWPSSAPHVAPGTVQASMLTADEAGTAVGETLGAEYSVSTPPPAILADPESCAVAVGPSTQAVYTTGWTIFGSVTYQDSRTVADHTVNQVLGVYPDPGQAGDVFGTLTDGLNGCRTAVRGNADQRASQWTYSVDKSTADTLGWTATQTTGNGWACYHQARLKGKAVLQVSVCEAGDGSQAATAIATTFAGRVTG